MSRALGVMLLVCLGLLSGCSSPRRPAELPTREALVSAHNQRVSALETLWARTSVRVEGRDAEGSRFSEQGEGHLQVQRPGRVAVTVGKLGEVYFALGSNEDRYWLIDVSDGDIRSMTSGSQSRATPQKAARLGLPVHPRDIPLLLGLLTVDAKAVSGPDWDDQGRVVLRTPTRWGSAELRFDPRSLELVGSAAFDADGVLLGEADLSRHGEVFDENGVRAVGWVPLKIEMRVPGFDGFVRMELGEPRVRPINPAVFDPEVLARAYRVRERIDLDDADGPPGSNK